MHIWPKLSAVLHPADHPSPPSRCRWYETKFALATLLQPKTIFTGSTTPQASPAASAPGFPHRRTKPDFALEFSVFEI